MTIASLARQAPPNSMSWSRSARARAFVDRRFGRRAAGGSANYRCKFASLRAIQHRSWRRSGSNPRRRPGRRPRLRHPSRQSRGCRSHLKPSFVWRVTTRSAPRCGPGGHTRLLRQSAGRRRCITGLANPRHVDREPSQPRGAHGCSIGTRRWRCIGHGRRNAQPLSAALAGDGWPSYGVALSAADGNIGALDARLRSARFPIIGRLEADRIMLDLRTVIPRQDKAIVDSLLGS